MAKWRIEFYDAYTPSPMSFWVHRHLDNAIWRNATEFDPKLPAAVPAKGFPVLVVDVLGVTLRFSSVEEVSHFLEIIRMKNMPTPLQLAHQRNAKHGPNSHWLSRLPANLKPWTKREKIIPTIEKGLAQLKAVYGQ